MAKNKLNKGTQLQGNNLQEEYAAEFAPQNPENNKAKKKRTSKTK